MAERRRFQSRTGWAQPLLPLAGLWLSGGVLLIVVAVQGLVPYADLMLDPNYRLGIPWYLGLISNLGVLGWTAAAVSAYLGAWISALAGRRRAASMLIGGALLTTMLLADDLFQLHSTVGPALGLPKVGFYAAYAAFAFGWLIRQYHELRRTRVAVLLAGGAALALSIVADQGIERLGAGDATNLLAEDALKFLGILAWAQYFSLTTIDIVRSILVELSTSPDAADTARAGDRSKLRA